MTSRGSKRTLVDSDEGDLDLTTHTHIDENERKRGRKKREKHSEIPVKPEHMTDAADVCVDRLQEGELYRIIVNEPATLSKLISGVNNLISSLEYIQIWESGTIGIDGTDMVCIVGMRMTGLLVLLSDEIDDRSKLFCRVDITRLAQCLARVRPSDKLIIRKMAHSNKIELISYGDEFAGESMSSELNDDTSSSAISNFDPKMVGDAGYEWHITDIDVQTFRKFVSCAADWKAPAIRIQIWKHGTEYIFCLFTKCPSDGTTSKMINRITREDTTDTTAVSVVSGPGHTYDDPVACSVVWRMRKSTDQSISMLTRTMADSTPEYDHEFSTQYLSKFLRASETSSVLSLHVTVSEMDGTPFPIIMRYSVGSISETVTYLKFAGIVGVARRRA